LADSSFGGLIGLVDATGSRPTFADCQLPRNDDPNFESCWDKLVPDTGSLFIALQTRHGCSSGTLSDARLVSTHLDLIVVVPSVTCPPGHGTVSVPNYTLVAIPLDELPRGVITVAARFAVGNAAAAQLGDNAIVDLREPQVAVDTRTRLDAASNAINSVNLDAIARFGQQIPLIALSVRRFGSSPTCAGIRAEHQRETTPAFVITIGTQTVGDPANGVTYIAFPDRAIYCAKI
jgi:hypothetical protein